MDRETLDSLTRIAVARARATVDDTLTEFKGREMGHVEAESLIESIRARLHENLAMMCGVELQGSVRQADGG